MIVDLAKVANVLPEGQKIIGSYDFSWPLEDNKTQILTYKEAVNTHGPVWLHGWYCEGVVKVASKVEWWCCQWKVTCSNFKEGQKEYDKRTVVPRSIWGRIANSILSEVVKWWYLSYRKKWTQDFSKPSLRGSGPNVVRIIRQLTLELDLADPTCCPPSCPCHDLKSCTHPILHGTPSSLEI